MRFKQSDFLAALAIGLVLMTSVFTPTSPAAAQSTEEQIVTTKHQVTVCGCVLRYTARAGRLPILDNETGEVHGRIFFTAYTLDAALNQAARPLTFLWNGGPGSSSSLVH